MNDTNPSPEAQNLVLRYGPPEIGRDHWFTTIHPLASEGSVATANPEVALVDLYWAFRDHAFFVSLVADPARPISASFTPTKGAFRGDFFVLAGGAPLTGTRVDLVLRVLANWIQRGADLGRNGTIDLADLPGSDSARSTPRG